MDISEEYKKILLQKIIVFFSEEFGEDIGQIRAHDILGFFIDNIGKDIYNNGVEDSYKYMNDRIEDILALQKL
ncbi:DUF2164 domain-containing protein [Oceanotoga sp. DSM 15011]|uniref:DUF2164 domain-containing protein n=1 Tax=Oceanotoga sp. DSM 15011 TaxID=2984951 RepID=UPI0021F4FCF8|nr:DUF2164 domain-containing protein [Oceanotoga sp. DSM 15011]UYP01178.1 DUF2164 domain-containing protein [Oceanotoga sp. DSM 15011]